MRKLIALLILTVIIAPLSAGSICSIRQSRSWIPASTRLSRCGRLVDKIEYTFLNDAQVLGEWKSVDFVRNISDFTPTSRTWKKNLFLKNLHFLKGGDTKKPYLNWTKGLVIHVGDKTASRYLIKNIGGTNYLFFEWKSGDYILRYQKPRYYVLKQY